VSDTQRNGGKPHRLNARPPDGAAGRWRRWWVGSDSGAGQTREGRRIAGVCVDIAERDGWDPTIVRRIAVLDILLPGPQVLAYLVLWLVIPNDGA
jgi:phage shock protein PspC (stress-responsive transcriptional regulator)